MADLSAIMDADLVAISAMDSWGTPTEFTFGEDTFAAIISPEMQVKEMEDAGYLLKYNRTAVVSKSLFDTAFITTEPANNDTITITINEVDVDYRITGIEDDGTALTLQLKRIN